MEDEKRCSHCGVVKPLSEFTKNRTTNDGLSYWCKDCVKEVYPSYKKKWRANNPEYFKKYQSENKEQYYLTNERYRKSKREMIDGLKTKCAKCGESRVYLIQFHHINPDEKEKALSDGSIGKDKALKESKKCICLCANCHIEFHYLYGKHPKNPVESLKNYLGEEVYDAITRE